MVDMCLTRVYLESLSTEDLLQLADKFGLDIPFSLRRNIVIETLLESAFGNEEKSNADDELEYDFLEAAALPKQYNITFIDVMIRDPLWAFVFWEIKAHDRELCEKQAAFDGYCLKVVPIPESGVSGSDGKKGAEDGFIVPVSPDDTGLYLNFPPAEGLYRVELCAVTGGKPVPLIVSRPFRLPRLVESLKQKAFVSPEFLDICNNPLACLSGAIEFPVIRNTNRLTRNKDNPKPGAEA
ncbi:MAG: DUF4912 domain-containing protein [Treponema sp.]|nr:DUF4912 domain-containing protein [Treponema sp.]